MAPLQQITVHRAVEAVIEQLEGRILDGTFATGDMLPAEEQLAAQLGVGRRSVREALKVLAAKGLIEVRMGVGAIVTRNDLDGFLTALSRNVSSYLSLNRADIHHVRELRVLLEGAALARLAATPDPLVLRHLNEAMAGQRKALAADDPAGYQDWHCRFHEEVIEALHNPVISMLFRQVFRLLHSAMEEAGRRPGVMFGAIEEHQRILDSITRADSEMARQELEDHLAGFVAHLDQPKEQEGYVEVR